VSVQAREVLGVIAALKDTYLQVWIDGGWGVDALLHEVTRPTKLSISSSR
jgi:hypothetical protein